MYTDTFIYIVSVVYHAVTYVMYTLSVDQSGDWTRGVSSKGDEAASAQRQEDTADVMSMMSLDSNHIMQFS